MGKAFRLSKRSLSRLNGVSDDIVLLIQRVIDKSPHDFGIPQYGGFRTAKEQRELYDKVPKVTRLDGYKRLSYHQSGNAFDIFVYDEHGACWKCKHKYYDISKVVKNEFKIMQEEGHFIGDKIIWGGDWQNFNDSPHFEIRRYV